MTRKKIEGSGVGCSKWEEKAESFALQGPWFIIYMIVFLGWTEITTTHFLIFNLYIYIKQLTLLLTFKLGILLETQETIVFYIVLSDFRYNLGHLGRTRGFPISYNPQAPNN